MKNLLVFFILMFFGCVSFGQEIHKVAKAKDLAHDGAPADTAKKRWFIQGSGALAVSQAAFSNWAAGGENSVGLAAFLNVKANYKKGKHAWANTIDLGYGLQYLGNGSNAKFTKTNDKLELTTAYGYELDKNRKWYITVLANFKSQFTAGYNYPDDSTIISNFMAPGYLVVGLGVTYTPAKWFYLYVSPTSGRFTFVLDQKLADAGSFGVEKGKNFRGEFGPYVRADLNKDLAKNINLSTTLELFTDYLKDFGNIDVNWSMLLSLKVNKWLATSISAQVIYDNDVMIKTTPTSEPGPRTQFKELLGVGISYTFH
jgi:hypothetical protein